MSKRLWNLDCQAVIVRGDEPAIQPGEPFDFEDDEFPGGVAGSWSEEDPRKGLETEKRWKAKRDEVPVVPDPIPAESGNTEEA